MIDYRNRDMSPAEYLEALVEMHNQKMRLSYFDEKISLCNASNYILLKDGIEELAKIANASISIESYEHLGAENLIFRFVYQGVEFWQVRNKKEWEEHKNVLL